MIETIGARTIRVAFVPQHMHARMGLHSAAMITGALLAVRLGTGGLWWTYVGWYLAAFVGFHVALIPLLATWFTAQIRFERWVQSLVEQELIRFDLQAYDRQLKRVLTANRQPPDDGVTL